MYALAFILGFILLGWILSSRWPVATFSLSGKLLAAMLLLHGVVIVSGAFQSRVPALIETHRWSSHGLVIYVWSVLPLVIGAVLQRELKSRPLVAIFQTLLLIVILPLTLLCSFTGHLTPDPAEALRGAQETHNRFVVLHLAVLPTLLALAILLACWMNNSKRWDPKRTNAESPSEPGNLVDENEPEPTTPNPYRTPRAVD